VGTGKRMMGERRRGKERGGKERETQSRKSNRWSQISYSYIKKGNSYIYDILLTGQLSRLI
jgi:hypothetical protein